MDAEDKAGEPAAVLLFGTPSAIIARPTAFGTLMALEPAIGVLLGLLVLHQQPSTPQIVGILLVVFAGTAAQRDGQHRPRAGDLTRAHSQLDLVG